MMTEEKVHIHWFRRDLRLFDHRGLAAAARSGREVLPLFIFDPVILSKLDDPADRRVGFIHQQLDRMRRELEAAGSALLVLFATPQEAWREVLARYSVGSVSVVGDYEPYARVRDGEIQELLREAGVGFTSVKDQVIFEKSEVTTQSGEPYRVFTPYARSWKQLLNQEDLRPAIVPEGIFLRSGPLPFPSLRQLGFQQQEADELPFPVPDVDDGLIARYGRDRDYPAIPGTSRLGVHLRFGTISVRQLVARACRLSEVFLNELIWREFYQMVLWHHPESPVRAIREEYNRIVWEEAPDHFEAWCQGRTGYPLVDAGMRELNRTGYMHNRLRMVTASFLSKHLLIDWRKGERYFAGKLLDYEMASNVGGWQWAAGCGHDAAPYFRIFNPERQQVRFDSKGEYIRRYLPEWGTPDYPVPIVEHRFARKRALERYRSAIQPVSPDRPKRS